MELTIAAAGFGSLLQEALHWYELRHRVNEVEFKSLLRSFAYWGIVIFWAAFACAAAFFWYVGAAQQPDAKDAVLFGAALPALAKKGLVAASERRLGRPVWQTYLGL